MVAVALRGAERVQSEGTNCRRTLAGMLRVFLLALLLTTPVLGDIFSFYTDTTSFLKSVFTYETCSKEYVKADIPKLSLHMDTNLFGQHIVKENLITMLNSHFRQSPKKALVISMHGWTGCGKNHVTNMIIESMYKLGVKSKFVHLFIGRLHFPLSTISAVTEYKLNLQSWVRGNVSECPESLFVFDEIDKMPGGIIDALKPFLDYHTVIDGIDFRKATFIFLSNVGGNGIVKKYHSLWQDGVIRENMRYRDFESILRKVLHESVGAFEKSSILEDHLVSLYLPFLPLEKEHVRLCVEAEMERQGLSPEDSSVSSVLDEMEFFQGKYSISGCKRVADQVALLKFRDREEL